MAEAVEVKEKRADTTAAIVIWKNVVEKELRTAAEWERNWGFLKAPTKLPRRQKPAADTSGSAGMNRSASSPAGNLGSTGKAVLSPTKAKGGTGLSGYDPEMLSNDRFRMLTSMQRQVPKERYSRPITTSQELGWRTTLERFPSTKGLKRSPELWPEM
eukprot:TRINITY_DN12278_c0_g1_i1.p1 TRINITY_DN12278_c0_g1~~TRINITY_DN12278_c0_g1_i1.p1  ORF type:complete len:182 (-),score=33.08 TRINITY_DN12278_c0_g1_i1:122-595(-)